MTMPEGYAEYVEQVEENEALKLERNLWNSSSSKAVLQEILRFFDTSRFQVK